MVATAFPAIEDTRSIFVDSRPSATKPSRHTLLRRPIDRSAIQGDYHACDRYPSGTSCRAAATRPWPIKARQQATWASGDFAVIGTTLQIVGDFLAEAVDVRAGDHVLDVAAGNGNATLAAARRFARVSIRLITLPTCSTRVPRARQRKACKSTSRSPTPKPFPWRCKLRCRAVDFRRHVHARPARGRRTKCSAWSGTAAESALPTGHPEGFMGNRVWLAPSTAGQEESGLPHCRGNGTAYRGAFRTRALIKSVPEKSEFPLRVERGHWMQIFGDFYGPTHKAFPALDSAALALLKRDIAALLARLNIADNTSLVVPGDLEVVIIKR